MSQRRNNRSSNAEVDISELKDSIKECVRFLVCREGSKIPIKRGEIIKHLSTTCQTPTNKVSTVIIEANKVLKKVSILLIKNSGYLNFNVNQVLIFYDI